MEDPGVVQAAYDYCPTGNNPALPGTPQTPAGQANPLRQGAAPYDDGTKVYVNPDGTITPDYSGVGMQGPAMANGNCQSGAGSAEGGRRYSAEIPSGGPLPKNSPVVGGCGVAAVSVQDMSVQDGPGMARITIALTPFTGLIYHVHLVVAFFHPGSPFIGEFPPVDQYVFPTPRWVVTTVERVGTGSTAVEVTGSVRLFLGWYASCTVGPVSNSAQIG